MAGRKSTVMCRWRLLAVATWATTPALARAHDFNPGVLALTEIGNGRFDVAWTEPIDSRGSTGEVRVVYPPHCQLSGRQLECGAKGLRGEIAFAGALRRTQIAVSVRYRDGDALDTIVTGADPRVRFDKASRSETVGRWIRVGAEHVVTGLDHVAFVVGLFLVTGIRRRRLVATITAFTLAHSLTLAPAALHIVELPRAPVEATIAASVMLVARESMHREQTLTRMHPWLVAFAFGLIHGLGFAGALGELELPRGALGLALLSFNVGVELAQLAIVGSLFAVANVVRALLERGASIPIAPAARSMALVLGAFGAYWFIDRVYFVLNR
ncbi:HupE/UreJ family protein [Pendulispora albinea]|uniref:HupE/UreJ family protein n=1 Tax=Pendulispora albinea TaxID=2741071 RepID=A0ABZ2M769_9BACT